MSLSLSLTNRFSLSERTAIVTGAASGLGLAIARGFAEADAHVVLADLNEAGATEAAERLNREGRRAFAIRIDVSNRAAVQEAVSIVLDKLSGVVDVLVNCAGINTWSKAVEVSEDMWASILDVNLTGTFYCCQAVGPHMLERKSGSIINMASIAGIAAFPGVLPYAVSKAGVIQLTRSLAVEWAPVRVNALAPSTFDTPMVAPSRTERPEAYAELLQRMPLARIGQPEEIVGPALFLATEASALITGHTLAVDGGYLAQ